MPKQRVSFVCLCCLFRSTQYIHTRRYGASTKAAVIRIGLGEMWEFIKHFDGKYLGALLESCGIADLIATCFGGRNRKVSEAFVTTGKVNLWTPTRMYVCTAIVLGMHENVVCC